MKHWVVILVCAAIFLVSVWSGWRTCNWSWVQRSGTLIVAVGVLLESWKVVITPRADDMPFWQTQEVHSVIRAAVLIVCVGTFIQGYADLIFHAIFGCS